MKPKRKATNSNGKLRNADSNNNKKRRTNKKLCNLSGKCMGNRVASAASASRVRVLWKKNAEFLPFSAHAMQQYSDHRRLSHCSKLRTLDAMPAYFRPFCRRSSILHDDDGGADDPFFGWDPTHFQYLRGYEMWSPFSLLFYWISLFSRYLIVCSLFCLPSFLFVIRMLSECVGLKTQKKTRSLCPFNDCYGFFFFFFFFLC